MLSVHSRQALERPKEFGSSPTRGAILEPGRSGDCAGGGGAVGLVDDAWNTADEAGSGNAVLEALADAILLPDIQQDQALGALSSVPGWRPLGPNSSITRPRQDVLFRLTMNLVQLGPTSAAAPCP